MSSAVPAPVVCVSSTSLVEGAAGQPASLEGAMGSALGGGAEVPGVTDGAVPKTDTASTPDPMPPDLIAFTCNLR